MILVIDNYDSFTYNLVQYLGELGAELRVFRNDEITVQEAEALNPEKIVVSPGPCTPNEAGVSCDIIRAFGPKVPLLGVCLGHQSIGAVYGGKVIRADQLAVTAQDSVNPVARPSSVTKFGYTPNVPVCVVSEPGTYTAVAVFSVIPAPGENVSTRSYTP